ncbi:hypothetical protein Eta_0026 [Serratia phage Eta]|uniref:Ead/Ea22-like family protein n=1 Tax=Serratia phage Eta TaxID=1282995 RepID=R9W086_9CAUD|nr:hypothetical protein Eta_0026 [Serratia phage Eta]AGN89472.1 hypothetical protein Eta_0026 [Serratia phage Eta]
MGNKLGELSKPVAWKLHYYGRGHYFEENAHVVALAESMRKAKGDALYSQEYVSALISEHDASQKALKSVTELWNEQRQRIAELEAVKADASEVFKEIGNELGCNPDNESIMAAIDELKEREKRVVALAGGNAELWETMAARLEAAEKRLATPKPPEKCPTCNRRYTLESYAHGECAICGDPFDADDALRAMGFTVEGDE